jgi:heat shock protein HslJ
VRGGVVKSQPILLGHFFTPFAAAIIAIASGLVLSACATPPSKESTPPELKGVWLVEDVDQRGVIDRARLAVVFGDRGQISGQAGCNRFAGTLSLEGGAIKVGPLGAGRMMCPPALMDMEARMLRSLQGVDTLAWAPNGALVLTGPEDRHLTLRPETVPTHRCGEQRVELSLQPGAAYAVLSDGSRVTLKRVSAEDALTHVFSNGLWTFFQDVQGERAVRFAHRRMAPQACERIKG